MDTKSEKRIFIVRYWKIFAGIITTLAALIAIIKVFTPDPTLIVIKKIAKNQEMVRRLSPVIIPDSLTSDGIQCIQSAQQRVLYYSAMMNININEDDRPEVKTDKIIAIVTNFNMMYQDFVNLQGELEKFGIDITKLDNFKSLFFEMHKAQQISFALYEKVGQIYATNQKAERKLDDIIKSDELTNLLDFHASGAELFYEFYNMLQLYYTYDVQGITERYEQSISKQP